MLDYTADIRITEGTHLEVVDIDNVGLCKGAYGCTVVGVDALDAFGLVRWVVWFNRAADCAPLRCCPGPAC